MTVSFQQNSFNGCGYSKTSFGRKEDIACVKQAAQNLDNIYKKLGKQIILQKDARPQLSSLTEEEITKLSRKQVKELLIKEVNKFKKAISESLDMGFISKETKSNNQKYLNNPLVSAPRGRK